MYLPNKEILYLFRYLVVVKRRRESQLMLGILPSIIKVTMAKKQQETWRKMASSFVRKHLHLNILLGICRKNERCNQTKKRLSSLFSGKSAPFTR
ncbi:hypothetical protein T11_8816 [Trichinella zimbabwensis]|uniref:Uncharacterized protein n=1 Tax=Trichinella zimbabwensis TaxID=268475 RepID=A0A0V1GW18_9BILA|nr:hypothetical protein T11_8816 [Trichinella zimbabwensis]